MLHAFDLLSELRVLLFIVREKRFPFVAQVATAFSDSVTEIFQNTVRHKELGVFRPAIKLLDQFDFVFAQRLTVRSIGVLLVRGAIPDMAVDPNHGRPVVGFQEAVVGISQHLQIICVGDVQYIPSIGCEAFPNILGMETFAKPSSVT